MEHEAFHWKRRTMIAALDKECKVLRRNIGCSGWVTVYGVFVPNMKQELAEKEGKIYQYSILKFENASDVFKMSMEDIVREYQQANKK